MMMKRMMMKRRRVMVKRGGVVMEIGKMSDCDWFCQSCVKEEKGNRAG
jgi:hypothetical protein